MLDQVHGLFGKPKALAVPAAAVKLHVIVLMIVRRTN
jgi:hypothetical protein